MKKMTISDDSRRTKMDLYEFLSVAVEKGLATTEELKQFAADWQTEYENGEPGFGDETTFEDWRGGLKCWRFLAGLLERNGLPRNAQIDWSNIQVKLTREH